MTIEEIKQLKDGTRVILTQLGSEWGEDAASRYLKTKGAE